MYTDLLLVAFGAAVGPVEAYFDAHRINRKLPVVKWFSIAGRGVIAYGLSYLFSYNVWHGLVLGTAMLVAFWITFDMAVNYFRGKSQYYIGKTKTLDKFFRKIGSDGVTYAAFKGVVLYALLILLRYL